mmetsp:Transcript_26078/g.52355  ORF Transcript_26078/g.52355 Transcript_26078/m.52355 type:complete len:262 (-) Transcript_26078:529-1314(-)
MAFAAFLEGHFLPMRTSTSSPSPCTGCLLLLGLLLACTLALLLLFLGDRSNASTSASQTGSRAAATLDAYSSSSPRANSFPPAPPPTATATATATSPSPPSVWFSSPSPPCLTSPFEEEEEEEGDGRRISRRDLSLLRLLPTLRSDALDAPVSVRALGSPPEVIRSAKSAMSLLARLPSCPSINSTTTPAASSVATPLPATFGFGSTHPTTTRATPLATSVDAHGGVLLPPLPFAWLQGSRLTYAVAPFALSLKSFAPCAW